jgi:glycosyltransferase involved in cell wall biosynthesis
VRIAIVGPAHPYKGGAAQHSTELAHRLAAAGHDVALESWSAQYPKLLYPGQLTVNEPELPLFHPTRRRLSWRRPDRWLREGRRIGRSVDLVVFQYHSTVQAVPYLGMLLGMRRTAARRVIIANNVLPHERRAADERLVRALFDRMDGIVVHSPAQAELARTVTGTPARSVALPPHFPGHRSDQIAPLPQQPHNRLLFFGLVRPYKGLDVLLHAMAQARARPALTVAGEFWGGSAEIRELVSALDLGDRVTIRDGYVDVRDIPELFGSADALVLPYREATGSQNALLAFEYGLPVIVTRTGALAEPVTDGVDGIVCRPGDVADLARAIDRFYADGEPERLRASVKRPDSAPAWQAYLDTLLSVGMP